MDNTSLRMASRIVHPDESLVSAGRSFAAPNPIMSNNVMNPNKAVFVIDPEGKVTTVTYVSLQLVVIVKLIR